MIGTTIQGYEIIAVIGEGAMGTVYLARHTLLKRDFAIKELDSRLARNTDFRTRFIGEAQRQMDLKHDNIVSFNTLLQEGNGLYLVLEYVDGSSLAALIRQHGQYFEPRAIQIVQDILRGLGYAHSKGVIHRDIKPANILMAKNGVVKISDFGIAITLEGTRLTHTGAIIGTPHYMSPEQIQGVENIDGRSDLYSVGIILYELISGKVPFWAPTDAAVYMKHLNEPPPDIRSVRPDVSERLAGVINRALVKKPEERFADADAFIAALEGKAAVSNRPNKQTHPGYTPTIIVPRPEDTPRIVELPPKPKTNKGIWIAGVAVAAAICLLVALFGGKRKEEAPAPAAAPAVEAPKPVQTPMPVVEASAPAPAVEAPKPVQAPIFTNPLSSMEFVTVKGGCFQMGDVLNDNQYPDEKPVHEACVSDFRIGKFEVTQGEWKKIMGNNPSEFKSCGANCPVENVSWNDVQTFLQKLNAQTSQTSLKYRLPTEAEWEYAARSGGKRERYSGGDNAGLVGWYVDNSGPKTHPVGQKQPNGLGIYDMSGNVWEWVSDRYGTYPSARQENPTGPKKGDDRVLRGGSWVGRPGGLRASTRGGNTPDSRGSNNGFRLVCPLR